VQLPPHPLLQLPVQSSAHVAVHPVQDVSQDALQYSPQVVSQVLLHVLSQDFPQLTIQENWHVPPQLPPQFALQDDTH
jgi:hypothetical protein